MIRKKSLIGSTCLAALVLGSGSTFAQQNNSSEAQGSVLEFGISSTLSATDNYRLLLNGDDSAEFFDTRLTLGYINRRDSDVFRFNLGGVVRAIEAPGNGARTLDDITAGIGYDREGANSRFTFGVDYRLVSVNFLNPFDLDFGDDPLEPGDFIDDVGDREQFGARFSFETGVNDPIGFIFDGRYRKIDYTDTTDPDLYNTEVISLGGTTRFTLSPVTEGRIALRLSDYKAEDSFDTDRQTTSVGLGLRHELSSTDTLDISIGRRRIETEETILGVRQLDTERGLIGSIDLTRELALGTIGTSFDVSQSVNGQTETWLVSRAMPLPRGALEISLGLANDVANRTRPVGALRFQHEMATSTLTASIERSVSTTLRSEETATTRASLGYTYEINSISVLGFSLNYVDINQAGGPAINDVNRTDFRATYARDLTRDWQLLTGYEYQEREEAGVGSASSNRIFMTLERKFSIRP
ncbi:hypothetical protein [Aestuariivita boseongensis]|uniref:hypothetical protein n=1 Tax=Aestuariivita boseongensis TaxID=1470562 RepID=UPI000681C161|nr:hypothetical protein [Aestuariivita boseongensis]